MKNKEDEIDNNNGLSAPPLYSEVDIVDSALILVAVPPVGV